MQLKNQGKSRYLKSVFAVFIVAALLGFLSAAEPPDRSTSRIQPKKKAKENPELTRQTLESIDQGLDFLVSLQGLDRPGATGSVCENGRYPVACTALAGLAFLAAGSTYNRGKYGANTKGCVDYFLNKGLRVQVRGYFFDGQSRMHGHGFATMFLAEVYGTLPPGDTKTAATAIIKAIECIELAQTKKGGWYYQPKHRASPESLGLDEASITITMVQALRAARNAGFYVKKGTINRAIEYVRQSATPRGFRYSLTMEGARNRRSFELTAAAVSVLHASGVYSDSKELGMGLKYMREVISSVGGPTRASGQNGMFYFYGNLYAAQTFFQVGGEDWVEFYKQGYPELIGRQSRDGSWGGSVMWGRAYATAVACQILEIPFRYLPILKR